MCATRWTLESDESVATSDNDADLMTDPGMPRIRKAPLPDDAVLVVRGDTLDPDVLRRDASRFHRRYSTWGRYGISAFYARSDAEVDALCEVRLIQFPTVVVFARAELEANGIDVVATFRTPHVTLAADDLNELIQQLLACNYAERPNPYHVSEGT